MNRIIYEKIVQNVAPFHQKVLRLNYDIPLGELFSLIRIYLKAVGADSLLYTTPDFLECGIRFSEEVRVFDRDSFFKGVLSYATPMGARYPGAKTGVFDKNQKWYLRLFVDDPENVSGDEFLSGNCELYAQDAWLAVVRQEAEQKINGHFLLEGAKKYIELIEE